MAKVPQPRRPGQTGGGCSGKKLGSGGDSKSTAIIAIGLLAVPASAIAGVTAFVLHGYGVL